jgi:multidrug efflux pump
VNPSAPFIARPVATTLLTIGVALAGFFAFLRLPVAPLPQVDYPTITVSANMPGASPTTMAATVATPLERHLGINADRALRTHPSDIGNAARADLPTSLRQNPSYYKVNPAAAPVAILAMTSETLTRGQIYDAASRVMQQALSQIEGVGQVQIGGSSLPAVRVELNPLALSKYGIGLEDVRAALASANAHSPKGAIEDGDRRLQIYTNDKANHAEDYRPLVIAYRNGAAVRLSDVAEVEDSVENVRNQGLANGKPAVVVILRRQPGANIIDTVERVKAVLPQLEASIPRAINVELILDRTTTIRSSLHEVERTLVIAICLVVLVVFAFLRSFRAALIPSVAVPVSLIGTFGVMYLLIAAWTSRAAPLRLRLRLNCKVMRVIASTICR